MAKSVRISINKRGIRDVLRSEGVRKDLAKRMDRVQAAAEANSDIGKVTVDRRDYVGTDRARASIGIPGSLEARTGILSRALDAARGG